MPKIAGLGENRRIIAFGDVIDDIVVVPLEKIRADTDTTSSIRFRPGGTAANTASWLGFSGAQVDFVGTVGADDVERHSHTLERCGVTTHLAPHPTLPTGTIVVLVDGEQRTMLTERGANAELHPDMVTDALLEAAAVLHFSGYSLFGSHDPAAFTGLIARAHAHGVTVSVDPGSAGFIRDFGVEAFLDAIAGADILFPNLEEGQVLTGLVEPGAVAEALAERFAVVALTMDAQGALVATSGSATTRIPAVVSQLVDPTGAGDSFSAGFLAEWVRSADVVAAASAGAQLAARAVAQIGARAPF
jgi:sugar/nucleoside kinase (ribokinase family)